MRPLHRAGCAAIGHPTFAGAPCRHARARSGDRMSQGLDRRAAFGTIEPSHT